MPNLNSYSVTVENENGNKKDIEVLPVESDSKINWRIRHKGGYLNFKTKESVNTYLERKFHKVHE